MLTTKLLIAPVTLNPITDKSSSILSPPFSSEPGCIIKTDNAEISFFNGVDERIIQTINHHERVELLMKHDFTSVQNIYIICGKTDMRRGIDGLATPIQDSFELHPSSESIFLLSGWCKGERYFL